MPFKAVALVWQIFQDKDNNIHCYKKNKLFDKGKLGKSM